MAARSLTTSGGTLRFTRVGSGPPCLLLHGLGGSRSAFSRLIPPLAEKYDVIAIDLLGHGESDLKAPNLSAAAQAEAVLQLVEDLRIEGITLVGHSLGGSAAIHLAAAAPERVRKMVLLAAGCYDFRLPLSWRLLRSALLWGALGFLRSVRARVLRRAANRIYTELAAAGERLFESAIATREGWEALGRAYRQATGEIALSRLEQLVDMTFEAPALVVWGSDDRLVPVGAARAIFLEKPNVRFIEIAGGSHGLLEEDGGIVNDLILEFLS